MSSENISIEEQIARRVEIITSPLELAKEAKILNATTSQIIQYELWPHLVEFIRVIYNNPLIICAKSKQVGVSWTLALMALHWCYKTGTNVIELSAGEREATTLLDKSRFILDHLPPYLQLTRIYDGASLMGFTNHSRIHTLPSTKNAGVGETASLVIMDENEFHEYASENYANIKPAVDAGAHMVIVSTIDPTRIDTHFRMLLQGALNGRNNFKPLFFDCFVVPGRDEEWYERTRMDYPLEWQFTHNYPRTLEEALSPITGRSVFDANMLTKMNVRDPMETKQGVTHIYFRSTPGIDYIAGVDIAEGRGGDYSVLWIEGKQGFSRELCAVIHSNLIQPDTFAYMSYDLLREYHTPMVIGGADALGNTFLKYLVDMGYPRGRIYCSDKKKEKLGYQETAFTQERDLLALEKTLRTGYLQIAYKPAILELLSYQYKEKKDRAEPAEGAHNDLVSAMMKCNWGFLQHIGRNDKITISYSKTWKGG